MCPLHSLGETLETHYVEKVERLDRGKDYPLNRCVVLRWEARRSRPLPTQSRLQRSGLPQEDQGLRCDLPDPMTAAVGRPGVLLMPTAREIQFAGVRWPAPGLEGPAVRTHSAGPRPSRRLAAPDSVAAAIAHHDTAGGATPIWPHGGPGTHGEDQHPQGLMATRTRARQTELHQHGVTPARPRCAGLTPSRTGVADPGTNKPRPH